MNCRALGHFGRIHGHHARLRQWLYRYRSLRSSIAEDHLGDKLLVAWSELCFWWTLPLAGPLPSQRLRQLATAAELVLQASRAPASAHFRYTAKRGQ